MGGRCKHAALAPRVDLRRQSVVLQQADKGVHLLGPKNQLGRLFGPCYRPNMSCFFLLYRRKPSGRRSNRLNAMGDNVVRGIHCAGSWGSCRTMTYGELRHCSLLSKAAARRDHTTVVIMHRTSINLQGSPHSLVVIATFIYLKFSTLRVAKAPVLYL